MSPHMAQLLARQMLTPKPANTHMQASSQGQKTAKRPVSSTTKPLITGAKPTAITEKAQQAHQGNWYPKYEAWQGSNTELAPSTQKPVVDGSAGAPDPGALLSFETKQRLRKEALRRIAAGKGNEEGVNVARPSGTQQKELVNQGTKRQRGDEYLEDKATKRQKEPERPRLPVANVVPLKKAPSTRAKNHAAARQPSLPLAPTPYISHNVQPYVPRQQRGYGAPSLPPNAQPYHPQQQPGHIPITAQSGSQPWGPISFTDMLEGGSSFGLDDDQVESTANPPTLSGSVSSNPKISENPGSLSLAEMLDEDLPFGFDDRYDLNIKPPAPNDSLSSTPKVSEIPASSGIQDDQYIFGDFNRAPDDFSVFEGIEQDVGPVSADAIAVMMATFVEEDGSAPEAPAIGATNVQPVVATQRQLGVATATEQSVSVNGRPTPGGKRAGSEDEEGATAAAEEERRSKRHQAEQVPEDDVALESKKRLSEADQKRSAIRKKIDEQKKALSRQRKPSTEDYTSATTSINIDPVACSDSDIEDAFAEMESASSSKGLAVPVSATEQRPTDATATVSVSDKALLSPAVDEYAVLENPAASLAAENNDLSAFFQTIAANPDIDPESLWYHPTYGFSPDADDGWETVASLCGPAPAFPPSQQQPAQDEPAQHEPAQQEPITRPPYVRPNGVLPGTPRDIQLQNEYIRKYNLRAQLRDAQPVSNRPLISLLLKLPFTVIEIGGRKPKTKEMASENIHLEQSQNNHAKRKRPNTNEAGAEIPPSASTLSIQDTQNHQPHNTNNKKKPTAQDYLSADSSEHFNPLYFSDSDINEAFDDPWMVRELGAEATATTASTAQADLSGTENPPKPT
ncbi:MAG: hypothetical protein Q9184_002886 [Pyrenodesmia sp. 2 TL-2023]